MHRLRTLYTKTGVTLAVAFAFFMLLSVASIVNYILIPLAKQGADDLAALMVLSVQSWVELPPDTRPFLEKELMNEYQLKLTLAEEPLPQSRSLLPFLRFLEQALARRLGQPIPVRARFEATTWYCADIPMGGRIIRVSFPRERIGARPPAASLFILSAGAVVILFTTLLLVRRLTRPLARLSEAAARLGRGEIMEPLPETGPRELATLAHSFNRMAQEISELLSNRTTLFAGISHDLRTPITRMRLALELLPVDTDSQLLNRLRQDLEEMNQLIGNTLELARGLLPREPEEVDLREFVDGIVADYKRSEAAINWTPATCCLCSVDTQALRRILINLIDNAIRYGAGQPVAIHCHCDDQNAYINVMDRGPGIPAAEREAVFLPFHRLESSRNRTTGGSGLGLAIAFQLCTANHWKITLSPRDGGGTDARLTLPLTTAQTG